MIIYSCLACVFQVMNALGKLLMRKKLESHSGITLRHSYASLVLSNFSGAFIIIRRTHATHEPIVNQS